IIYVHLLKNPGLTVFQISKDLHISRSSIYSMIDQMYEAGILLLENGNKDLYFAEDPNSLLDKLSKTYQKNIEDLKETMSTIDSGVNREPYLNIVGYFNILGKIRIMLYGAEVEVYMNTDLDLEQFDDCFSHLERKGVDVYIFTFRATDYKRTNVHIFSHQYKPAIQTRMMLVIDLSSVLVANHLIDRNEWMGTITKNDLMVRIITEHIHHDIYLLRLKNKVNQSIFELYPDLGISTKFERLASKWSEKQGNPPKENQ
ncbi:MAG: helix-turn-helix domain-containing protein, partial [Acholeplasmataceae bacterium]|nr:helix-turn-helix domain-containing protein [Acholeplasmataceae bacterium]